MNEPLRALVIGEPLAELRTRPDGTLTVSSSGDALNVAVRLARGGARVSLASATGSDRFSADLWARLHAEGIDDHLVVRVEGAALGLYLVETDPDGERHFTYWRSASAARHLVDHIGADALRDATTVADLVVVSGITLAILDDPQRAALLAALRHAYTAGTRVAFDPNVRTRLWDSLGTARRWTDAALDAASVVLASTQDLDLLGADAAAWHRQVDELVVTDGAHRTRWWDATSHGSVAVVPTEALDTTGAGDAFDAAYLLARARGASVPESVGAGHDAARDAVGHPGGLRWD